MADFFEASLKEYPQAKKIANWLGGPVLMELNNRKKSINELKLGLADGEGVDSNFIHTQKLVLLDKEHVVRGYYNGLDSADLNKLAKDLVFIMLEKDKHYVSPLLEMRPILPLIIFILLATAGVVIFLSRKPFESIKLKA